MQPAIISRAKWSVVPATWVPPVSTPARRVCMDPTAIWNAIASIRPSATMWMDSACACLAGLAPTATRPARRIPSARAVRRIVAARIIAAAARTMATAFACPAGWETTATTYAPRASMANTACIPARVPRPTSSVMLRKDVSAAAATRVKTVMSWLPRSVWQSQSRNVSSLTYRSYTNIA